ncbi:MAG: TIGR00266 family protein [Verrucomicrobia bacterium]|nr:TIGR00266 family protein [Verrucomicrobiota bacterium]MBV9656805.1 TIGR00266 family protein [Verrucomicrobiota bacterium]
MQIFITRGGQQHGPYDEATIRGGLQSGSFSPVDMAWYQGAPGWVPLNTIPGLVDPAALAGAGGGPPPMQQPPPQQALAQPPPNIEHRIIGSTLPVLEMQLKPNESIIAVSGELSWMSASIAMQTTTQFGGGGGFFGAFKRMAGGGSLFMTEYTAQGAPGMLAFATRVPGQILPVEVAPGQVFMIHRHGFLCSTRGVELGVGFQQSLGAGIFGGDGFLLQKLSGHCHAWIELDGEVVTYNLQAGETLRVHPGHVGMFEASVRFEITRIQGIKNMLFGGDGIFLAALTGPGRIWLQSLPLSNLAHSLQPYLRGGAGEAGAAGGAGAVIGGVLRGLARSD